MPGLNEAQKMLQQKHKQKTENKLQICISEVKNTKT